MQAYSSGTRWTMKMLAMHKRGIITIPARLVHIMRNGPLAIKRQERGAQ